MERSGLGAKRVGFLITGLAMGTAIAVAAWVDEATALMVGRAHLDLLHTRWPTSPQAMESQLPATCIHDPHGTALCYVFTLHPSGFLLVSGDDRLPPILAYSLDSSPPFQTAEGEQWKAIMRADLQLRLNACPEDALPEVRSRWNRLKTGRVSGSLSESRVEFQQWPEPGSTATGGWVETRWSQGPPYNAMCPIDPVTGSRSLAGCPAVAMAQIVNYHQTTHGVVFTDEDDYLHAYAGRNFWIDDDFKTHGFASFADLSSSLAMLEAQYQAHLPITDHERAALTFACGVAAQQVYTSSASGTFGVDQAVQAYDRFNAWDFILLESDDPTLYDHMALNMRQGFPAHLAVLSSTGSGGHNLVVDGYNTDGFFHLNFGWGGSADGWYLIPDQLPYNLTVMEGAIVDIHMADLIFADGFESGDCQLWSGEP